MRRASAYALLLGLAMTSAGPVARQITEPAPTLTGTETYTVDVPAQTSAYASGLLLSESTYSTDNVTADSIRLVGFDMCDKEHTGVDNAIAQIYSGWQQAQKIMAVPSIKDGTVDFDTAGALEFLGASGLNKLRQSDMQTIFKNFATLTPAYWPLGWRIQASCDDLAARCLCGTPIALTTTKDPVTGLARILFCPRYFTFDTLNHALEVGKTLAPQQKYDMDRYWQTQGHVWAHELMHIDWVTGAAGPSGRYGHNKHVTDLRISFRDSAGRARKEAAYRPRNAKILARWPVDTGDYTIQNADNLALFMTSQYVQQTLGGYPAWPITGLQPTNPPYKDPYGNLFIFASNGSVTLNETNPLADAFEDEDTDSCSLEDEDTSPTTVTFSSFAPNSAYPTSYISSLSSWAAQETWAPSGLATEGPPDLPATSATTISTVAPSPTSPATTAVSSSHTISSTATSSAPSCPTGNNVKCSQCPQGIANGSCSLDTQPAICNCDGCDNVVCIGN